MTEHDLRFRAMGCELRLLVGAPVDPAGPSPAASAAAARDWVEAFDARLSRFRGDSELCALNADPRRVVPASPLLRADVGAARWAAERSGGLVDPTLVGELVAAGYGESRAGARSAPLAEALAAAPPRRPAAPRLGAAWRQIEVDEAAGAIRRPPGLAIDTGGTGKGLAADALAVRLEQHLRVCIDMAGDLRVAGPDARRRPYQVEVEHPLTGETCHVLPVGAGGVATSGVGSRLWPTGGGGFAHHLLDPSTGTPAWTGILMATALAPTALEAETLAKIAVLSGPAGARAALAANGGLIVRDDGDVEPVGQVAARRLRLMGGRVAA